MTYIILWIQECDEFGFCVVHALTLCGSTGFSATTTGVDFRNSFIDVQQGLESKQTKKCNAIGDLYAIGANFIYCPRGDKYFHQQKQFYASAQPGAREDKSGSDAAQRTTRNILNLYRKQKEKGKSLFLLLHQKLFF